MPTYVYRCDSCGTTCEAYRTVAERGNAPLCCGGVPMRQKITASYHISPTFQPYRAVGEEYGRPIRSKREHREYLRKHGYVEIGNDPSMAPPPRDPDREAAKKRETREALEQLRYAPADATG